MASNSGFVEVNIWRAKDNQGYTTTSSEGTRHELKATVKEGGRGEGRVGHVSMSIFHNYPSDTPIDIKDKPTIYASLWPGRTDNDPAHPNPDISSDIKDEGGDPDVIIRLHHLDIPKMIAAFNQVKTRIDRGEIEWNLLVSDDEDVTNPKNNTASCASFVWSLLKIGDINKGVYNMHVSPKGPKNTDFYNLTKCNLGQRFGGWFDAWPWTRQIFSPYALVLRVASAAEAYRDDKEKTTEIMKSPRVAKEKEWTYRGVISQRLSAAANHESNTVQTGSIAALAGAAILGGLAYARSQSDSSRDDRND